MKTRSLIASVCLAALVCEVALATTPSTTRVDPPIRVRVIEVKAPNSELVEGEWVEVEIRAIADGPIRGIGMAMSPLFDAEHHVRHDAKSVFRALTVGNSVKAIEPLPSHPWWQGDLKKNEPVLLTFGCRVENAGKLGIAFGYHYWVGPGTLAQGLETVYEGVVRARAGEGTENSTQLPKNVPPENEAERPAKMEQRGQSTDDIRRMDDVPESEKRKTY